LSLTNAFNVKNKLLNIKDVRALLNLQMDAIARQGIINIALPSIIQELLLFMNANFHWQMRPKDEKCNQ